MSNSKRRDSLEHELLNEDIAIAAGAAAVEARRKQEYKNNYNASVSAGKAVLQGCKPVSSTVSARRSPFIAHGQATPAPLSAGASRIEPRTAPADSSTVTVAATVRNLEDRKKDAMTLRHKAATKDLKTWPSRLTTMPSTVKRDTSVKRESSRRSTGPSTARRPGDPRKDGAPLRLGGKILAEDVRWPLLDD